MRILLTQPPTQVIEKAPSLGLGYLGAVLSAAGHTVRIIHAGGKKRFSLQQMVRAGAEFEPDIFGIQSFTFFHDRVIQLADGVKSACPGAAVVVGGPHAAGTRRRLFAGADSIDYGFSGEAEKGICELAELLEKGAEDKLDTVSGLIWRNGERVSVNPVQQVPCLDDIPFPLWDQLSPLDYAHSAMGFFAPAFPTIPFITSRGCDKACSFCQHLMKGLRHRSIGNCMEELGMLWDRFSISAFALLDQNFAFSESRVLEFCEALKQSGREYKWYCPNGVRLDSLTAEMVSAMRSAGCYSVAVGIESASPEVLRNMNKSLEIDDIGRGLRMLKEAGIRVTGNFILGFPGENTGELKTTLKYSLAVAIDKANFSLFVPYPGTKYFNDYIKKRDIESIHWPDFDVFSAKTSLSMPAWKMNIWLIVSYFIFYIRPRTLLDSFLHTPLRRYPFLFKRIWRILTG